jgi:heme-degrading monooxygenase HmoA
MIAPSCRARLPKAGCEIKRYAGPAMLPTLAAMSYGDEIARTPEPPYYAVIFTSVRTGVEEGYDETAARMAELAAAMPGFLGFESARAELGVTISYWTDLDSIAAWKREAEHLVAQGEGRRRWYERYTTRIALVQRDYRFDRAENPSAR